MNDAPERIKYVPIDVQDIYTAVDVALKRAFWAGYEAHKEFVEEQEPQQPTADWSRAPEWAQWWAMDADGNAIWFEEKPIHIDGSWETESGRSRYDPLNEQKMEFGIDWRCTLQQRPQEVTA
jgi:hypothetical protein